MNNRFSASFAHLPAAPLTAGLLLVVVGLWSGLPALTASYPDQAALRPVATTAVDSVEVRHERGAFARLMSGAQLDLQVALDADGTVALYRNDLPRYPAVKEAVAAGPATYWLWPDAPDGADRMLIWRLDTPAGPVTELDDTVATLRASRETDAVTAGAIALVGLVSIGYGALRWRRMARPKA